MTARPSTAAPILAALALLLLPLGAYVGGYHGLSEYGVGYGISSNGTTYRAYSAHWQCELFKPAAWIESRLWGRHVKLLYSRGDFAFPVYSTDPDS